MKKLWLITFLFLMGCPDDNPDKEPYVIGEIADVTVYSNAEDYMIDLTNVFTDDDNDDSEIVLSLNENSNPTLLSVMVNSEERYALLSFNEDQVGTAIVKIEGTSNDQSAIDAFLVTVNENPSSSGIDNGDAAFSSGDYADAEDYFEDAISFGDPRYIEAAYVGLSFSQLSQGPSRHADAYESLEDGLALSQNEYHDDFRAGLVFLDVAYMQDYSKAISAATSLLTSSPNWSMAYSSDINSLDVRLALAQAYYHSQDFENCLAQVKILDSSFQLEESDDNFLSLLADKLNALADLYRD